MASADDRRLKETEDSEALGVLLDRSLRGDPEAPRLLVTLLQTKHYQALFQSLRRFPAAHTQTVEDVLQDSILGLIEKLQTGGLQDLAPEHRRDFLQYFQRFLNGKLRNAVRARKSPVLARAKIQPDERIVDREARIPGESGHTEHLALIHQAAAALGPESEELLRWYREGLTAAEIARRTGKKEEAVRQNLHRLKERLLQDILPRSATARLHQESRKRPVRKWPTRRELEDAVASLPPTIQEAILFVHLQARGPDLFAASLGERGQEKAKARLNQGYRTLAFTLKVPFPEAFDRVTP